MQLAALYHINLAWSESYTKDYSNRGGFAVDDVRFLAKWLSASIPGFNTNTESLLTKKSWLNCWWQSNHSEATLSKWYHRDVSIGGQRWQWSPEEGAALVSVDRATKAAALAILGNATYGDARQESVSPTAMAIEKTTFSEPAKRGGDVQKKGAAKHGIWILYRFPFFLNVFVWQKTVRGATIFVGKRLTFFHPPRWCHYGVCFFVGTVCWRRRRAS